MSFITCLLLITAPLGLPPIPWPEDNPYEPKKAELGRLLYFDKRLSADGTISCASCHSIPKAFTDRQSVSTGIFGHHGTRHAPTIINAAYQKWYFWDGRAKSLEEQCLGPITNPLEMAADKDAHKALLECQNKIENIEGYKILFKEAFGTEECTMERIAKAIATFERTVLSGNSPFDQYKAGNVSALTSEQKEGFKIFKQVGCANCHGGELFSDVRFINIGIGMDKQKPDLGRYMITKNEKDWGAFKVPTLRDVENTYPYMHDGSLKTLEEVVEYYNKGGIPNKNLHPLIRPLHLTSSEKQAIVSFLKSLSGTGWQHFKEPTHFP